MSLKPVLTFESNGPPLNFLMASITGLQSSLVYKCSPLLNCEGLEVRDYVFFASSHGAPIKMPIM